MKINKLFLYSVFFISATVFYGCENDDIDNPSGVVAVNMMNVDNGKTVLGNSDVYIDNANNFYGSTCVIANIGKKNGLGNLKLPVLNALSNRVALEPNHAYQIFRNGAFREFPSGKQALHINAEYYNVFVVSQIKKDGDIVGANVKYVLMDAPDNGLPEYNSYIGELIAYEKYDLTIELPTSDFECVPAFASSSYYTLEYEKKKNKLLVKLIDYNKSDVFGFYIRIGVTYTYVYGKVK